MNDELDREALDAWAVDPLGAGFEDLVLTAWDAERPARPREEERRSTLWVPAIAFAAAAAMVVALWPRPQDDAPSVAIRAGASAQLAYTPGARRAEQTAGTVTYETPSGTAFVVHTPAADVTVNGTVFTVEMLDMNNPTRQRYLGAGALALTGAAVAVYVTTGSVEVRNDHGAVQLRPGQTAVASESFAPRTDPAPRRAEADPVAMPLRKRAKRITPAQHDDARRRIQAALTPAQSDRSTPHAEDRNVADEQPPGKLDEAYIREVVTEDLVPIAKECYESALEDDPALGGRLTLQFSIVGDASVGGIVDEVSIDDENSTLRHPSLGECMTESTATLLFDPPEDGGRVVVHYPFVFEPGDE